MLVIYGAGTAVQARLQGTGHMCSALRGELRGVI